MSFTVAVGQFAGGTDKAANRECLAGLAAEAGSAGAGLLLVPEYAMCFDPDPTADLSVAAESLDGEFATSVRALARTHRLAIVAGMSERVEGERRILNTVIGVGPDGADLGCYRKLHLYDAFGVRESDQIRPGAHAGPMIVDLDGLPAGVMTCYDLRFPETARYLVDAGARVLLVPAAWAAGPAKEDHWRTLLRARAIENTVYVVAAGLTGPRCSAQSMIVDPMGVQIAGAGEAPGIATAALDPERLASVRAKLPSLQHRRFRIEPAD